MLNQRIGSINSDRPLMGFTSAQRAGNARYVLGEGLVEMAIVRAHGIRCGLDGQDVGENGPVPRVETKANATRLLKRPRKIAEGVEITFEGEYYNESYDLNNDGDLRLVVKDSIEYPAGFPVFKQRKWLQTERGRIGARKLYLASYHSSGRRVIQSE